MALCKLCHGHGYVLWVSERSVCRTVLSGEQHSLSVVLKREVLEKRAFFPVAFLPDCHPYLTIIPEQVWVFYLPGGLERWVLLTQRKVTRNCNPSIPISKSVSVTIALLWSLCPTETTKSLKDSYWLHHGFSLLWQERHGMVKHLGAWWWEHVAEALPITVEQEASEEPGTGHNTERLYFIHIDCTIIEPIDLQNNNYMKNKPSNHEHIKEISGSNLNKDPLRIRLCVCVIHVLMLVFMHVHLYVCEDQRFNVSSAVLTATICPPWWTISWNCEPQQTFPSLRSFCHCSMESKTCWKHCPGWIISLAPKSFYKRRVLQKTWEDRRFSYTRH